MSYSSKIGTGYLTKIAESLLRLNPVKTILSKTYFNKPVLFRTFRCDDVDKNCSDLLCLFRQLAEVDERVVELQQGEVVSRFFVCLGFEDDDLVFIFKNEIDLELEALFDGLGPFCRPEGDGCCEFDLAELPVEQAGVGSVADLFFENGEVVAVDEVVDDAQGYGLVEVGVLVALEIHLQRQRHKTLDGPVGPSVHCAVVKRLQVEKDGAFVEEELGLSRTYGGDDVVVKEGRQLFGVIERDPAAGPALAELRGAQVAVGGIEKVRLGTVRQKDLAGSQEVREVVLFRF